MSIDTTINNAVAPLADWASGIIFYAPELALGGITFKLPLIVMWLIAAGLFCTVYYGFISFTGFKQAVRLVRGKYADPTHPGEVTHFEALATALSGTVGLGNIAGVAVAITLGGPGAAFWMILAGFLGMSLKFAECTLAVKYRQHNADGTVSGGPMYYLSIGIPERFPKLAKAGKAMGFLFAVACSLAAFGIGNMFQVNQAYQQVVNVTGGPSTWLAQNAWAFGLLMAILTGLVIIGGMKGIARVTSKLTPFMCGLYLIAGAVVLAVNAGQIPAAIMTIIREAFTPLAVTGGIFGAIIAGFRRAAFSNEAGFGSAAIAHSAVKTDTPVTEGLVALLEPFVDTIIVCAMTALVIVVTGVYHESGVDGVTLTSHSFATVLPWFPVVLAMVVFLFAYSTMISWFYYGDRAWFYLFGHIKGSGMFYKLMYLASTVVGVTLSLGKVIDLTDSFTFSMAMFNIIGLYLLAPVVKQELTAYRKKYGF